MGGEITHKEGVSAGLVWVLRCPRHCQNVQLAAMVNDDGDVAWRCSDVNRTVTLAVVDPSGLVE